MVDLRLVYYIKEQLEKDVPFKEIEKTLQEQGWGIWSIDAAVRELERMEEKK